MVWVWGLGCFFVGEVSTLTLWIPREFHSLE